MTKYDHIIIEKGEGNLLCLLPRTSFQVMVAAS